MKRAGVMVARKSYIACVYLGELPDPCTAEYGGELPES